MGRVKKVLRRPKRRTFAFPRPQNCDGGSAPGARMGREREEAETQAAAGVPSVPRLLRAANDAHKMLWQPCDPDQAIHRMIRTRRIERIKSSVVEKTARDLAETRHQRKRMLAVELRMLEHVTRQHHVDGFAIPRQRQADAPRQHRYHLSVEHEDVLSVHRAAVGRHLRIDTDDIVPVAGRFRQRIVDEPAGRFLPQSTPKYFSDPAIAEARNRALPENVEQHDVRPDIARYFRRVDVAASGKEAASLLGVPILVEPAQAGIRYARRTIDLFICIPDGHADNLGSRWLTIDEGACGHAVTKRYTAHRMGHRRSVR